MNLKKELFKTTAKLKSAVAVTLGKTYDVEPITADFYLAMGRDCTPALWLRRRNLRLCSAPLDWMVFQPGSYELVPELFRTGFRDFFTDITPQPRPPAVFRSVGDNRYHMIALHHFRSNISLEEGNEEMRGKALERFAFLDACLRKSKHTVLLSYRTDAIESISWLGAEMQKLYGGKFTTVNIRDGERQEKNVFAGDDGSVVHDYTFRANVDTGEAQWENRHLADLEWKRILRKCRLSGAIEPKNAEDAREVFAE